MGQFYIKEALLHSGAIFSEKYLYFTKLAYNFIHCHMSGTLHSMSLILLTFSSSVTRSLGINLCDIVLNLESDTRQTVMCLFDQVIGYIRNALAEHPIFRRMKLLSCGRHGVKKREEGKREGGRGERVRDACYIRTPFYSFLRMLASANS